MIAAAGKIRSLAGNDTRIVAGHGPLGAITARFVMVSFLGFSGFELL
jgi:hypothetical protein